MSENASQITQETFVLDGRSQTAWEAADFINRWAVAPGMSVLVNGTEAHSRWTNRGLAQGWGTGTLSVKTHARTTRGDTDVWYKAPATVVVTVVREAEAQ